MAIEQEETQVTQPAQLTYAPTSDGDRLNAIAPTSLAVGMAHSLNRIEETTGLSIDEFVGRCLGEEPDTLYSHYSAEQIDGIALCEFNKRRNRPTLIANDTGTGKGRIVGSQVKSAIEQRSYEVSNLAEIDADNMSPEEIREAILNQQAKGGVAVVFTKDPGLYVDLLARDFDDVGIKDKVKPFFTNAGLNMDLTTSDGKKIGKIETPASSRHNKKMQQLMEEFRSTGTLSEYNVIFSTYDQMNQKDSVRREFIKTVARGATLIMDECHLSGGASGPEPDPTPNQKKQAAEGKDWKSRSQFFCQDVLPQCENYVLLSATAFKDSHILSRLMSAKSAVRDTGIKMGKDGEPASFDYTELGKKLQAQGVPGQQNFTQKLAVEGELFRVEKSMEGVEFESKGLKVDVEVIDRAISIMQELNKFDDMKGTMVDDIASQLSNSGRAADGRGAADVSNINFGNIAHHFVQGLLLSAKADALADEVVNSIRSGEKPKVSLFYTNQSIIQEWLDFRREEIADEVREAWKDKVPTTEVDGETIKTPEYTSDEFNQEVSDRYDRWINAETGPEMTIDFGYLLTRQLRKMRTFKVKDAYGRVEKSFYVDDQTLQDRYPDLYEQVKIIQTMCDEVDWAGLPVSPIDYIKDNVESKGFSMGEMTGRFVGIDYSGDVPRMRTLNVSSKQNRAAVINGYNNGTLDSMITNVTTGWSAHAHIGKMKDLRRRRDIVAQSHPDINQYMQALGRTNRFGQLNPAVHKAEWYTDEGVSGWGEVKGRHGIPGAFGLPKATNTYAEGIPYERRQAAIVNAKMASLNANTTGTRSSESRFSDAEFFGNKAADVVVQSIMQDFPGMHQRMGKPLGRLDDEGEFSKSDKASQKVTGKSIFLSTEEQGQFYDMLTKQFVEYVEQREALGESPLESKVLPLDAQTLARSELAAASTSSQFGGATWIEQIRMKALSKPLTSQEVAQRVRETLTLDAGDADSTDLDFDSVVRDEGREHSWTLQRGIVETIREQIVRARENIAEMEQRRGGAQALFDQIDELKGKISDQHTLQTEAETERVALNEVTTREGERSQNEIDRINALNQQIEDAKTETQHLNGHVKEVRREIKEREKEWSKIPDLEKQINVSERRIRFIQEQFDIMKVGAPVNVDGLYGVVTAVERNERVKNVAAGGAWKFKVAVVDSAKEITLKLGDCNTANGAEITPVETGIFYDPPRMREMPVGQMFDEAQTQNYEIRQVITGNVLADTGEIGKKGKYISFTTQKGATRHGILLPKNFDYERVQHSQAVPAKTPDHMSRILNAQVGQTTGVLKDSKQMIAMKRFARRNPNTLSRRETGVQVQINTGKPGKPFYTNETLLQHMRDVEGNPVMEKKGKVMRGFVPQENLEAFLTDLAEVVPNNAMYVHDPKWKDFARTVTGEEVKRMEIVDDSDIDLDASELMIDTEAIMMQMEQKQRRVEMKEADLLQRQQLRLEARKQVEERIIGIEAIRQYLNEHGKTIDELNLSDEEINQLGESLDSVGDAIDLLMSYSEKKVQIESDMNEVSSNVGADIEGLIQEMRSHFNEGKGFKNLKEAGRFAGSVLSEKGFDGVLADRTIQEAVEKAGVLYTRDIFEKTGDRLIAFDASVQFYEERLPALNVRTTDSMAKQQYSTPTPLGMVVQQLAGIEGEQSVYEPTIGNGSLVTRANPENVMGNEIDPARAAMARSQGISVTENDATTFLPEQTFDVVVANPPFGGLKEEDGSGKRWPVDLAGNPAPDTQEYETPFIDHAIAFKSLRAMKDDGRAVIVLGAPLEQKIDKGSVDAYRTLKNRSFYHTLYNNYNVTQHFTVDGDDIYRKQGTTFPVDVIVIEGRGQSDLPLPGVTPPPVYETWSQLRGVMQQSIEQDKTREEYGATIASLERLMGDKTIPSVEDVREEVEEKFSVFETAAAQAEEESLAGLEVLESELLDEVQEAVEELMLEGIEYDEAVQMVMEDMMNEAVEMPQTTIEEEAEVLNMGEQVTRLQAEVEVNGVIELGADIEVEAESVCLDADVSAEVEQTDPQPEEVELAVEEPTMKPEAERVETEQVESVIEPKAEAETETEQVSSHLQSYREIQEHYPDVIVFSEQTVGHETYWTAFGEGATEASMATGRPTKDQPVSSQADSEIIPSITFSDKDQTKLSKRLAKTGDRPPLFTDVSRRELSQEKDIVNSMFGLSATEMTQMRIERHDHETAENLRNRHIETPSASMGQLQEALSHDLYSPTLGEMQAWLENAQTLERPAAYIQRIETLIHTMTTDLSPESDAVFDLLEEMGEEFINPIFFLSEKQRDVMTRDDGYCRDKQILKTALGVLEKFGKVEGSRIIFDPQEKDSKFKITLDTKSRKFNLLDTHSGEVMLSSNSGNINYKESRVTPTVVEHFNKLSVVIESIEKQAKKSKVFEFER